MAWPMVLALLAAAPSASVSLDLREASVRQLVPALAEAAGRQAVLDPEVECRLTLRTQALDWRATLEAVLRACSLGLEEQGNVLRVARRARLVEEARAQQAVRRSEDPRLWVFRPAYARAEDLAALLLKLMPEATVVADARTNTVLVSLR